MNTENNNVPNTLNVTNTSNQVTTPSESENICPNCGKPVNPNTQMCIRCGTPLNIQVSPEVIPSNNSLMGIVEPSTEASLLPAIIIDIVIILIFNLLIDFAVILNPFIYSSNISVILTMAFISGLILLYFLSFQKLLIKAKLPWWGAYIPGYNVFLNSKLMTDSYTYILGQIIPTSVLITIGALAGENGLTAMSSLASIISFIISIMMLNKFCKRFGANLALLIFFYPVYYPIIAFSQRYTID